MKQIYVIDIWLDTTTHQSILSEKFPHRTSDNDGIGMFVLGKCLVLSNENDRLARAETVDVDEGDRVVNAQSTFIPSTYKKKSVLSRALDRGVTAR